MLGFDAAVHELRAGVGADDLSRIVQLPYAERMDYFRTLTCRCVARIPYRTWVDHLLEAEEAGRARLLHGGGYPYLFYASGADVRANFAITGAAAVNALSESTWYLVEAWDQS